MATTLTSPIDSITRREASGPGALAHWGWNCPECTMVVASTMRSGLDRDVWAHVDFHANRKAGK